MVADELRRQADDFIDLIELQSNIGRDPNERLSPREPRHHAPEFPLRTTTMTPRGNLGDLEIERGLHPFSSLLAGRHFAQRTCTDVADVGPATALSNT
jgi:hypothetical protein